MVRIPSEYQEVEYIESSKAQYAYINTEVPITEDVRFVIDFQSVTDSTDGYLMGGYSGTHFYLYKGASGYFQTAFGCSWKNTSLKYDTKRHTFDYSFTDGHLNVIGDGNVILTVLDTDFSTNPTIKIAGTSSANAAKNVSRTFSSKMFRNSELIQNLIPCYRKSDNEIGMYDTVSKTFFTNQGTGTFLKGNDVTYDNVNLMESRRRILLNTPHLESLTGSTLSFKTDMASKLKECKIHFTPIQEGSGDPSPDNVRPIHGWDGVTVTRCGKNLTPDYSNADFWNKNAYFSVNGNITNNNYRMCDYKLALPNKTYIFSSSNARWKGIGFYDAAYNPIAFKEATTNSIQLYAPSNTKFYRVYGFWSLLNKQLEECSEQTDYEPYTATTLTIPFPQTIYGGYVDLVKGEVVEELDAVAFNGNEAWNLYTSNDNNAIFHYAYGVKPENQNYENSSHFIKNNQAWVLHNARTNSFVWGSSTGKIYIQVAKDLAGTAQEFKEYLAEQYSLNTPVTLLSYKATPTTYPLDPVTIRTLRGLNNIWSDANGSIEIKYWTH